MSDKTVNTITVNEVEYEVDALSDDAKTHISNLRFTDNVIARLRGELAIAQTARVGYSNALQQALDAMKGEK